MSAPGPDSLEEAAAPAAAGRVEVRPVTRDDELRAFIRLPWRIYRNDPAWVPPLRRDVRRMLDPAVHPFHRHSDVRTFLALRDGRPVGRIAAIHNRRHVEVHDEPVGFFGFFESVEDPEVSSALFDAAAGWLRERGLEVMRGPTSFSTNEETGLLVEGFDRPPAILMPHNPPYYPRLVRDYGFHEAKTLLAYWLEAESAPERLVRIADAVRERSDLTVRSLDMNRFDEELARVKRIYNAAWEENWGFVPMTEAEFDYMAAELKPVLDPDLAIFVEDADGRAVGFGLSLPDYNMAIRHADGRLFPFGLLKIRWHARKIDRLRVLALGLLPEYRRRGVDGILYVETFRRGLARGIDSGEFSWVLEDNERMKRPLERMGAHVHKRYRLYDVGL